MSKNADRARTVVIRAYRNSFDANIALTRLRDAGIMCALTNDIIADVWGLPGAKFDSVRLMVNADDADRANAILDDVYPG